jgi:predicted DCC family thiol-disulfide oxidoreductase YuxK
MLSNPASARPALIVYFDGGCPVCSREIGMYRRQPGAQACEWVDASTCTDEALGEGLDRRAALARFHVRRADGTLVEGMRGFAMLWQSLPRTAWLGRLAAFGPFPWLLDRAYAVFLTLRRMWRPADRAQPHRIAAAAALSSEPDTQAPS